MKRSRSRRWVRIASFAFSMYKRASATIVTTVCLSWNFSFIPRQFLERRADTS